MSALALPGWGRQARRAWDRISVYLPVVLMAVLALGSYWVLKDIPPPPAPVPVKPVSHDPDYFMRDFAVRSFTPEGRLRAEVSGSEMRHYPDTETTEIDNATIRQISAQGTVTVARAQRVWTNADRSQYLLQGHAVVVREAASKPGKAAQPEVTFEGEELRVFAQDERLESDLPVLITRGSDRITAARLRYDQRTRVADLQGRVRATLAARPK